MAQIFDLANDITLTYDGDLAIDETQDLSEITSIEWFKREVNKILRTKLGEWKSEPDIGLNIEDGIGKPNTREFANEIKEKIQEALSIDGFNFPGQFDVKVIPTSIDKISIYITYNVIGDSYRMAKVIYDLDRGISLPIFDEYDEQSQLKILNKKPQTKNKYLSILAKD